MGKTLKEQIDIIGQKLAQCNSKCAGVVNNPRNCVAPRCLALEIKNKNKTHFGFIFVGQNPGHADESEIKRYDDVEYSQMNSKARFSFQKKDFLRNIIKKEDYYKEIETFIGEINKRGVKADSIIWTEAVHCESAHESHNFRQKLEDAKNILAHGKNIIDFRKSNYRKIGDDFYNWSKDKKTTKYFSEKSWKDKFNAKKKSDHKLILSEFRENIEKSINRFEYTIRQIDRGKDITINFIKYYTKLKINNTESIKLPISTYSNCINNYLSKILKIKECEEWPIFVFDDVVFNYLCIAYPNRKIVRLKHPSKRSVQNLSVINNDASRLDKIKDFLNNRNSPPNQLIG